MWKKNKVICFPQKTPIIPQKQAKQLVALKLTELNQISNTGSCLRTDKTGKYFLEQIAYKLGLLRCLPLPVITAKAIPFAGKNVIMKVR
jgi:hypothetical protein